MPVPDKTPRVVIRPGAEKSLHRKHPWLFSGAIDKIKGNPSFGDTVIVQSSKGHDLAVGAYSPQSQIRVRIWSFNPEEPIGRLFFDNRIKRAVETRNQLALPSVTTALRLVNSENDGIPGLIVDRYDRWLVCQFLSAGVETWKNDIVSILSEIPDVNGIYERSDTESRKKEGMNQKTGSLSGKTPPETIVVDESGVRFHVDIINGHKTGFYIDQRENRKALGDFASGKRVLNCFSYTGGFNAWALKGLAQSVTNIDVSESALSLLKKNADLNGFGHDRYTVLCSDVFQTLRTMRDRNETFDMIVLDPPKFAHTSQQVVKAARGYKDINLLALKLLSRGGLLFTFSCSGHISSDLFQKILADAAVDSRRDVSIVRYLQQSEDHAVALNFPEGLYLKGLICKAY